MQPRSDQELYPQPLDRKSDAQSVAPPPRHPRRCPGWSFSEKGKSNVCRCPAGGADSLSYPATCRHGLSRRSRGNERSHGVLDGQSVPVIPLSCRRPRRIRPSCVILPRKSLARIQPPPADRTSPVRIRDRSRFHAILMTHVSDFHGQRASADWVLHGYITDCLQTQFARVNSRFVFVLWLR